MKPHLIPTDITNPITGEPLYVWARWCPPWERWYRFVRLTFSLWNSWQGNRTPDDEWTITLPLAAKLAWDLTKRKCVPCDGPGEKA
jgi:hypothetical protein